MVQHAMVAWYKPSCEAASACLQVLYTMLMLLIPDGMIQPGADISIACTSTTCTFLLESRKSAKDTLYRRMPCEHSSDLSECHTVKGHPYI